MKNYIYFGVILLLLSFYFGTVYMGIATFNYLLILGGFLIRKVDRKLHVRLMTTGISLDLILVMILEFQRDAIATAISLKLSFLNQMHIYSSSLAAALYIPMAITGYCILKKQSYRSIHQKIGYGVIFFRTLGFILMFSMLEAFKS